jgi:hypothetical protein
MPDQIVNVLNHALTLWTLWPRPVLWGGLLLVTLLGGEAARWSAHQASAAATRETSPAAPAFHRSWWLSMVTLLGVTLMLGSLFATAFVILLSLTAALPPVLRLLAAGLFLVVSSIPTLRSVSLLATFPIGGTPPSTEPAHPRHPIVARIEVWGPLLVGAAVLYTLVVLILVGLALLLDLLV